jgi:hypothetical protein
MGRPSLPMPEEVAGIAKALRAEGYAAFQIETDPSGRVTIMAGQQGAQADLTPLEQWRAKRGAA